MTSHTTRRAFVAAAGVTALAGCLGSATGDETETGGGTESNGETATRRPSTTTTGAASQTPGADVLPTASRTLPVAHTFEDLQRRTLSGGPPKDGIPSIDAPTFESAADGDVWLAPGDVVFGVVRGEDVRAYPQRILVWHEIANDTLGDEAVSVTYCPLTGTAMGFFRGETTFGVSGRLVNSNLVMYDRATDSRWPQMLATATSGRFRGDSLVEFPVTWTTWDAWRRAHPDTEVLSRDTGYARNYSRDPYGAYNPARGYYANDNTLFAPLTRDGRFRPKEVVVGARPPDGPRAFRKSAVRDAGLVRGEADETTFLAVYDPAVDAVRVYRDADDRAFTYADGAVVDESGTRHAPRDLPLDRVLAFDAMWFAWYGFYPGTEVYA
jgi:hypothetical protein